MTYYPLIYIFKSLLLTWSNIMVIGKNECLKGELKLIWRSCFNQWNEKIDAAFSEIINAYQEPHRFYHTTAHLAQMLSALNASGLIDSASVLACFYHDLIYVVGRSDNEKRSADICENSLTQLGVERNIVNRARALIYLTMHHQSNGTDILAQAFVDADMSVMGVAPYDYCHYRENIERECAGVENFYEKRLAFLKSILTRQSIFATKFFYGNYEFQARKNILAEIALLKS